MSREQIEEIKQFAKDLSETKFDCIEGDCAECDFADLGCNYGAQARKLMNLGYRKQSENTVEVVRCKDCEYFEDDVIDDIHQYFCNKYNGMMSPNLDGYCSYGELKMKGGVE